MAWLSASGVIILLLLILNAEAVIQCDPGHYGASCELPCPPHCTPLQGPTIRACDRDTGLCLEGCVPGWYGDHCNRTCSTNCMNNICNQENARCSLGGKEKYSGDFCSEALPTCEGSNLKADSDLRVASMVGDLEKVNCILTEGQADINCKSWFMMTPVMLAAENGHRDVLQFLLSKGADASQVDGVRNNILHLACLGGHLETVKFVLSKKLSDINSRDRGGMTPVMEAAVYGNREVVKLLVSEGADLSLADREGNNILHVAAERGDVELLKFILSQHVVDINIRNTKGHTAADMARQVGHNELANLLVP